MRADGPERRVKAKTAPPPMSSPSTPTSPVTHWGVADDEDEELEAIPPEAEVDEPDIDFSP